MGPLWTSCVTWLWILLLVQYFDGREAKISEGSTAFYKIFPILSCSFHESCQVTIPISVTSKGNRITFILRLIKFLVSVMCLSPFCSCYCLFMPSLFKKLVFLEICLFSENQFLVLLILPIVFLFHWFLDHVYYVFFCFLDLLFQKYFSRSSVYLVIYIWSFLTLHICI